MRKIMVSRIAAMMFVMAPNTGANAAAEGGATETPEAKQPEVQQVPEGEKGKVGQVDAAFAEEAKRQNDLISEVLAAKAAIVVPTDHNSPEYMELVKTMSFHAKETGDAIGAAAVSSAKAWPMFEALNPMEFDAARGRLNVSKFLNAAWDAMLPEVKLANPMKPGKFFGWNDARIRGNSAAKTIENVRNYIRNNGERLYPQFFTAPKKTKATGAGENVAEFKKADKAVKAVLDLTYLPLTQYVELDDKGQPKEGAKPVTLAELLRAFEASAILPHIPTAVSEKDKAEKAAVEQTAAELEAERKAIEEEKAALAAEKAEMEEEKKRLEKERKEALLAEKRKSK